jgi:metallophosphoesterase (TIGR00282 family)
MKVLFLGDVVGRSGREAVMTHLPRLRERLRPDLVVVNGENAAAGFGLTNKLAAEFFEAGVDCLTTGNHVWDQRELIAGIEREPRILRPLNYPEGTPGQGWVVVTAADGRRLLVVCLLARLFMDMIDDPFAAIDRLVRQHPMAPGAGGVDGILVDFHGEATSEKMAMGHFLDGRVSAVIGTHSHIPTADAQILPAGTGYQTDAGMCGDYNSVIGMKKDPSVQRFVRRMPTERLTPAEGEGTVCGVLIETDNDSGLARRVDAVRLGARLAPSVPTALSSGEVAS